MMNLRPKKKNAISFSMHGILLVIAAMVLISCQESQSAKTLRFAHVLDAQSTVHQAMLHFGHVLDSLSEGQMQLEAYASGQLGNERECLELLQLGSLDLTKVSSAVAENFIPEMGVFNLPYLFRDADHYWDVFNGEIGQTLLTEGTDVWLRGLGYYDEGFRSFFLRENRVEHPTDLNGLKIRVMRSNLSIRTVNLLGGNATPLAYSELYSALQQGVVDGAENNPPNFYQKKFYEQSKYFVLDEHSAPPGILLISTHTWDKLSSPQKAWVMEAAEASVQYQKGLWSTMTEEALNGVREAGITVIKPDKTPFFESVAPIYESLKGNELGTLAERIIQMPPSQQDSTNQGGVQ